MSAAAPVGGATPAFTVTAGAANSVVNRFGNWSFTGNLDILALDPGLAAPPTSLTIDATVPVVVFAAGTGGVDPWTSLNSITIANHSSYVILSGAETQPANGGGLLQAGATGLTQIVNTTSDNSFYDLSGLGAATVRGLALQGGNGTGVGEVALSNAVLTAARPSGAPIPTWSGIQVLDAVGNAPGGTIDLANFGTLSELTNGYVLRTDTATPLTVAAGNVLVQFLNAFGGATGPAPTLAGTLSLVDGPQHLAVNLQGVADAGKSLNFSLTDTVAPAGSTLALWLSDTLRADDYTSVGYFTNVFNLPTGPAATTRKALFLGTEFFHLYPADSTHAIGTATFQDAVAGTTIATASDLYIGRTTGGQSAPFASPTDAIGHDSIEFRSSDTVLNANGAGMTFLGTSDLVTINGAGSGGIVMDVGNTHTGTIGHVSGVAVTGSQTYQNLLQGSSGQVELMRTGSGAWEATRVYTSSAKFGVTGNSLMGIGNDVLKGGAGTSQPGSDSAGGDNFFGLGGNDQITLDTTPGRHASTVWIGFYDVGHADNGASGARTGSAAVLNYYGQAITTIDANGNEVYANGYGLPGGYFDFTPPAGFGAEGWSTSIANFHVGTGGDRLNFDPPDWIAGTTFLGSALGLVNGSLEAVGPGAATAQRMSTLSRQVAANTTLVLDGLATYANALDLAAGLASLGGHLAFAPTHDFGIGSSFHVLVAYATAAGTGSLHVADVWIRNQSVADASAGFRTDTGMSVQASDLVHLDGLAGSDLDQLGNNVFFPIAKSSGTGGNDTLTGNSTDQLLDAGDGDDTIIPGSGHETFVLGTGADTVRSSLSNLMGDTFRDFAHEDRIVLTGIALTRGDLSSSDGGLTFSFTQNGTNTGSVSFRNGLPGGDLMLAHVGSDTVLTYVNYLPALDEGAQLSGAAINGIVNRSYLNGDTASSFSVRVEAASGASFHNTLGTYQVGPGGTISDVHILAGDVRNVAGLLSVGGIAAGNQLGFFLVQDGANVLPPAALGGGGLSFVQSGNALVLALDGTPIAGANTFFTHDASKNVDGAQHVLSGVAPDGSGTLRIGFEDLLRNGASDDDFQDVVVTVTATGWHG